MGRQLRLVCPCPADPRMARVHLLVGGGPGLEPPVEDRLADQLGRRDTRVLDELSASLEDPRHERDHTICKSASQASRAAATAGERWIIVAQMDRDAVEPDAVDRDAHVRAARRRQALDALVFEQEREAMLVEQLEDVLAEAEGARLDVGLFAQMSPDEARLVQAALGGAVNGVASPEAGEDGEPDDDFWLPLDIEDPEAALQTAALPDRAPQSPTRPGM